MQRKRDGSCGAVSVFLAIILVPCLVFTCIFGDLSRVQLSKAAAASAADLALYSMISHYDEDLKEYYGLVSSCQTTQDFIDQSEKYFIGMMQAEGLDDTGSALLKEYFRSLQSGDYTDFLRTEFTVAPQIKAAENGTLGQNPALIEDGIVEFMKYRGPVRIAEKVIKRFQSMDIQNTVKNAEEDQKIVEKKQDYAEKEGDLLKAAFNSYLAIRDYEKHQQQEVDGPFHYPSFREYKSLQTFLKDARDEYKGVTNLITNYYYPGTESIRVVAFGDKTLPTGAGSAANVGEAVETESGTIYCLTSAKLAEVTDIDDTLKAVEDAAKAFVDGCTQAQLPVSPGNGDNRVVYCMKIQDTADAAGIESKMASAANTLVTAYGKLLDAAACEEKPEGSDLPADWQAQISSKQEAIQTLFKDYFTQGGGTDYRKRVDAYYNVAKGSNGIVAVVEGRTQTLRDTQFGNVTLEQYCKDLSARLNKYYTQLEAQKKRLDIAIDGGSITYNGAARTVPSLADLAKKAEAFSTARTAWGTEAGRHNTPYAQEEKALYNSANAAAGGAQTDDEEAKSEALAAKITRQSVDELRQRLDNIRQDIQDCLDALDAFTYGGVPVRNIDSAQAAIDAAWSVVPKNEDLSKANGENKSKDYYNSLMSPLEEDVYKSPETNSAKNGNDPDLANATPDLYKYLLEQFKDKEDSIDDEIKNNDSRNKEYKDQAGEEEKNAKEFNGSYVKNKGQNLDASQLRGGDDKVSLGSALFGIVNTVNNIMNGNSDQIRDQLYVCEYIMDMFTYSTLDNEGQYRIAFNADNSTSYRDFSEDNGYGEKVKERWEHDDETDIWENQSLTNRHFNTTNNYANLGEVEYILYGNPVIEENLKDAYKDIFTIREALNLVSGFCNFYTPKEPTGETINGIALAINGATMGIVPIPLTKCVLIGVLATMESAKDLERLKKGAQVEFYKAKPENWVCSWAGVAETAEDAAKKEAKKATKTEKTLSGKESGLYYSDYMYIFLVFGLTESEEAYTRILTRVGDLIQANMRLAKGESGQADGDSGQTSGGSGQTKDEGKFTLDKCISYYRLTGTVRVKPLLITLPLVVNTVDEAAGVAERTDWCTYEIDMIRGYS